MRLIQGNLAETERRAEEKWNVVFGACMRTISQYERIPTEEIGVTPDERMKPIYHTIKCTSMQDFNDCKKRHDEYMTLFFIVDNLLQGMPTEAFVRWFPIDKVYDGERLGMKDYFSTMEMIKQTPIITDPMKFMMDYCNPIIGDFMVNLIGAIVAAREADGEESPIEHFCKENGVRTYRRVELDDGRYLMVGSDGSQQIARRKLPNPAKLRVVKGSHLVTI